MHIWFLLELIDFLGIAENSKGISTLSKPRKLDTFVLLETKNFASVLVYMGSFLTYPRGKYEMERYRLRTKGVFTPIERLIRKDTSEVHWRSVLENNFIIIYGFNEECRVADEKDEVFQWLLEATSDARYNVTVYKYKQKDKHTKDSVEKVDLSNGNVFKKCRKDQGPYIHQTHFLREQRVCHL